jgi:signal peptidase II
VPSLLPLENFRNPLAMLRFFGVCTLGLAIDVLVKYIAQYHLEGGYVHVFLPGWLQFEWVQNYGAVFGIGAGKRWLFVAISVFAFAFLTYLFATSRRQWGYQIILGMLMAGVLGNLYDRAKYGYVRDMFRALPGWKVPGEWQLLGYPPVGREVFPYVFNVADILLVTGVCLMLTHAFLYEWLWHKPEPAHSPAAG